MLVLRGGITGRNACVTSGGEDAGGFGFAFVCELPKGGAAVGGRDGFNEFLPVHGIEGAVLVRRIIHAF